MSESIMPTIEGILKNYIERQHIMRYVFCSRYIKDKIVVDVACGVGYGSHYLARCDAKYIIAIDLDGYVLSLARKYYNTQNLVYVSGDARHLPLRDNSVDIFVSFETIEHLSKPEQFLKEIARVLKPSGMLIISTPNKRWTRHPSYHLHEFYPNDFYKLLEKYFVEVEKYAQYISYTQLLKDLYIRFYDKVMRVVRLGLALLSQQQITKRLLTMMLPIIRVSILSHYSQITRRARYKYHDSKPLKIYKQIIRLLENYEDCRVVPFGSRIRPLRIMIAVCRHVKATLDTHSV